MWNQRPDYKNSMKVSKQEYTLGYINLDYFQGTRNNARLFWTRKNKIDVLEFGSECKEKDHSRRFSSQVSPSTQKACFQYIQLILAT